MNGNLSLAVLACVLALGHAVPDAEAAVLNTGMNISNTASTKLQLPSTTVTNLFKIDDSPLNLPLKVSCGFTHFYWEASCELTLSGPVDGTLGSSILATVTGTFRHKFPDLEDSQNGHEGETNPNAVSFNGSLKAGDIPDSTGQNSRQIVIFDKEDPHESSVHSHKDDILISLGGVRLDPTAGVIPNWYGFSEVSVAFKASHPKSGFGDVPVPGSLPLAASAFGMMALLAARRRRKKASVTPN